MTEKPRFFKFMHWLIDGGKWGELSLAAKALYPVIGRHVNFVSGQGCFASYDTLQREAGLARQSVCDALTDNKN